MKRSTVLIYTLVLALVAWLGIAGFSQAKAPGGPGAALVAAPVTALGTSFTYQGRLSDGGSPADGDYDFEFKLYDALSGGGQVGSAINVEDLTVTDGLFIVKLDFGGGAFTGDARWLQVGVRPWKSSGAYTVLRPRQELTAAPYALYALNIAAHNHWGQTWTGSGTGLSLSGGSIGLEGSGSNYGVWGLSASTVGSGLFGLANAPSGFTSGVWGQSASTDGTGVYGWASASSGATYGVYSRNDSTCGTGVYGSAIASTGYTYGVWGESASTSGTGVYGSAGASTGYTYGVYGLSTSNSGTGVYGYASATSAAPYSATTGVYGRSDSNGGTGVYGNSMNTSGGFGVYGITYSTNGWAIYGSATGISAPYAGYFYGDVHVTGDLSASGSKPFKIDHPLDPANQYLYHYSIESSEVLNQYSGNVTLDENGQAWVELPDWFQAINIDFRYQLTPIGVPAPNLYIAQEIQDNRFMIGGGEPGMKVSWTVTALRDDPYIQQYPHPVEELKPEDERGTYLYPDLYGQPKEAGLDYQRNPDLQAPEPQANQ
jgi:hypothetical protein